jgi:hypothetical protein
VSVRRIEKSNLNSIRHEAGVARIEVVSVELEKCNDALPQWTEALSRCLGRVPPSLRNQELTRCQTAGQRFSGRIEFANLGDIVLSKVPWVAGGGSGCRTIFPSI